MDLAILVLTICGLWRKAALKSMIGTTLSEQCLWYCAATFLVNIPAAVRAQPCVCVIYGVGAHRRRRCFRS